MSMEVSDGGAVISLQSNSRPLEEVRRMLDEDDERIRVRVPGRPGAKSPAEEEDPIEEEGGKWLLIAGAVADAGAGAATDDAGC